MSNAAISTGNSPAHQTDGHPARSVDDTEYVSQAGSPNRDEYEMLTIAPADVQRGDLCFHHGLYRTITQRLALSEGDTALYFQDHAYSTGNRHIVQAGVLAITVYRPRADG